MAAPPAGRSPGAISTIAITFDDQRAGAQHAIGKHDVGAREDDHVRASIARRAAPMATPSSPSGEISIRTLSAIAGRQAARAFLAHRLDQQVAGRRDRAGEDDDLGVERRREVGDRHADVLRGVAHDGDRHAVAVRGAIEHVLRR